MTVDVGAALRRIKPDKRLVQLTPRADANLIDVDTPIGPGRPLLLLDTNVYIRSAAGTLPPMAAALLDRGLLFHSAVCLGELTTGIANGDPRHPSWGRTRRYYADLIARIPPTRLLVPEADIWTEAGLIAGTLARTQGFQRYQRRECLNDALIHLQAASDGLTVLTSNRTDFDLIQQLAPRGRFVHYR